jgi:hypothetical protein
MSEADQPFALPAALEPDLQRVYAFWDGLKRGQASVPFWDDLDLGALGTLSGKALLLDVFEKPLRFRFSSVGKDIAHKIGRPIGDKFADEVEPKGPLAYFSAQCSATVESAGPTYYTGEGFARLVLPLWGDGRIGMLLGAIA